MVRQSGICLIAIAALCVATIGQSTPRTAAPYSIAGYVLDVEENFVLDAEVHAALVDRSGFESTAYTDWRGFTLKNPGPGIYRMYASKGNEGYSSISRALWDLNPEAIPQVTLDEQSHSQFVVIPLVPRAAKLVVRIVSKEAGQQVEKAQLVLHRQDKLNYSHTTVPNQGEKGEFNLLVPPLPLCLEASAPGFESSYYKVDGSKERCNGLRLAPGEVKEVTITLQPSK